MENKQIITLSIIVLIVLALAGFFLYRNMTGVALLPAVQNNENQSVSSEEKTSETDNLGNIRQNMSLFDLFNLNKSVQCTYKLTDDAQGEGMMYVSGKKARAQMNIRTEGQATESNMVSDGETMYVWSGSNGMKMSLSELQKVSEGTAPDVTTNPSVGSLSKDMDVDCRPWVEDASVFTVPSAVTFVDFGEQLNKIKGVGITPGPPASGSGNYQDALKDACKQCDSLSGEQKTQCLQLLKC